MEDPHAKSIANLPFCSAIDRQLAQTNTMTSGRPSAALTPEQCQQVWSQAAPSGDSLPQANAAPYIVNFKQADGNQDGAISQAEFDAACAKGLVKFTQR